MITACLNCPTVSCLVSLFHSCPVTILFSQNKLCPTPDFPLLSEPTTHYFPSTTWPYIIFLAILRNLSSPFSPCPPSTLVFLWPSFMVLLLFLLRTLVPQVFTFLVHFYQLSTLPWSLPLLPYLKYQNQALLFSHYSLPNLCSPFTAVITI